MSDLTVFIITHGEESLQECMESIDGQKLDIKEKVPIEVIKGVHPMSEAFNEMHRRCRTPYFIQVDADVILNSDAIERLYSGIIKSNFFVYATYGRLYEEGFGPGGSVRCWKSSIFDIFKFRNARTVDRDFHKRARLLGFYRKDIGGVLGIHKPRHSNFTDYLKTKSDIEKWQFLKRPFDVYAKDLYQNLIKDPQKNRYGILGLLLGALSSRERISKSKDIFVERERIESIFRLLSADFDKFILREDTDFSRLSGVLEKSYLNYAAENKKEFTEEVFEELFDIRSSPDFLDRLNLIITL